MTAKPAPSVTTYCVPAIWIFPAVSLSLMVTVVVTRLPRLAAAGEDSVTVKVSAGSSSVSGRMGTLICTCDWPARNVIGDGGVAPAGL